MLKFDKNGENYKRVGFSHPTNGGLLFDYVKLIQHFMPSAFLIENVPGIVELDGGEQVRSLYAILEQAGYHMASPQLLDTSEFGIPQNRKRVFIIGSRKKKVTWALEKVNKKQRSIDYLQNINENLQNTETRLHAASSVQRYMYMAYGQREKSGRVDRIDPYLPSKTIIAGGSSGGGRSHLHPFSPRTMSVRESARLQTFPDWFVFEGPSARQFNQVGNAVPPVLAAMLANQIIQKLF
jgi:DNA (cytosine-5)-methyltransferase 1